MIWAILFEQNDTMSSLGCLTRAQINERLVVHVSRFHASWPEREGPILGEPLYPIEIRKKS